MKKKQQKHALTLIEMMIVIVLIGLIGTVIGVNMKGSLDEGRAFKTEQAMEQIKDILMLEVAKGHTLDAVVDNKVEFLRDSGLVKDPDKLLKDGWGQPFVVSYHQGDITVHSDTLDRYRQKKKGNLSHVQTNKSTNQQSTN